MRTKTVLLISSVLLIAGLGTTPASAAPPPPDLVNQVNGDGYADLVLVDDAGILGGLHNGSLVNPGGVPYRDLTWFLPNSNWTSVIHMAAGDTNGDGYSDLVAVKNDGTMEI